MFDNLIANTDRNPGNILIDEHDKVWFIDHTRSFAGQEELRDPEAITGFDRDVWKKLQSLPDKAIEGVVGPLCARLSTGAAETPTTTDRGRSTGGSPPKATDNFLFTLGQP